MKWVRTIVFIAILGVVGIGLYRLQEENHELKVNIADMTATLTQVNKENDALQSRIEYFRIPENLVKELKSQFNYKEEGEQLLIIVPKQ